MLAPTSTYAGVSDSDAASEPSCVSSVSTAELRPESITQQVTACAPGVAVLADAWFPGWSVLVDGVEADDRHVDPGVVRLDRDHLLAGTGPQGLDEAVCDPARPENAPTQHGRVTRIRGSRRRQFQHDGSLVESRLFVKT